jgi:hypothetical protein
MTNQDEGRTDFYSIQYARSAASRRRNTTRSLWRNVWQPINVPLQSKPK